MRKVLPRIHKRRRSGKRPATGSNSRERTVKRRVDDAQVETVKAVVSLVRDAMAINNGDENAAECRSKPRLVNVEMTEPITFETTSGDQANTL